MQSTADATSENPLSSELSGTYGHLIGGIDLVRLSGCSSRRDLTLKAKAGRVGFRVFNIPGRDGTFALTRDVAEWLWSLRMEGSAAESQTRQDASTAVNSIQQSASAKRIRGAAQRSRLTARHGGR